MSAVSPADEVTPPLEGDIRVLAVTTSASAEQTLPVHTKARYVTVTCDVDCYITFNDDVTAVTDPDETAVSGNGRTWVLWEKTYRDFYMKPGGYRFKLKGSAAGIARWYVSSP